MHSLIETCAIIWHVYNYYSYTKIMRGSPLYCVIIVIHITYTTSRWLTWESVSELLTCTVQATIYFNICHSADFLIHVFFHSDSLLHNSGREFLMRETVNLCGGSAHILVESYIQAAGLPLYLKLCTLLSRTQALLLLRIIFVCGLEKHWYVSRKHYQCK